MVARFIHNLTKIRTRQNDYIYVVYGSRICVARWRKKIWPNTIWLTCIYFILQKILLSFVQSFSIKGGLPKFRVEIMLKIMCQMYFALWPTKTNVIGTTLYRITCKLYINIYVIRFLSYLLYQIFLFSLIFIYFPPSSNGFLASL